VGGFFYEISIIDLNLNNVYLVKDVLTTFRREGTNGSAAQGVQQPYEISVVTAIEEAMDISIEMVVYPNPATDFFKLRIKNYDIQ